ncbi:MAG: sensor histidine kinase, partial [Acidobacteria bacterium]|nr:sensor histidine kinase [Acidobacteriota bacterium]
MHPLLASRARLGLYVAAWLLLEILLAAAVVATGGIGWLEAAGVILPLYLLYAFACLSTWYL